MKGGEASSHLVPDYTKLEPTTEKGRGLLRVRDLVRESSRGLVNERSPALQGDRSPCGWASHGISILSHGTHPASPKITDRRDIVNHLPDHAEWCWHIERTGDVLIRVPSKSMSCPMCAWNARHSQLSVLLSKMGVQDIYQFPKPETAGAWRGVCQKIKAAGCEYVAMANVVFTNYRRGEMVTDLPETLEKALMAIPVGQRCRPSEGWYLFAPRIPPSTYPEVEALAEVVVPFDPFSSEPEPPKRFRYKLGWAKVLSVSKQLGYDFPRISDTMDGLWRWDCSCLPAEGTKERNMWAVAVGEYEVVSWASYQDAA